MTGNLSTDLEVVAFGLGLFSVLASLGIATCVASVIGTQTVGRVFTEEYEPLTYVNTEDDRRD